MGTEEGSPARVSIPSQVTTKCRGSCNYIRGRTQIQRHNFKGGGGGSESFLSLKMVATEVIIIPIFRLS